MKHHLNKNTRNILSQKVVIKVFKAMGGFLALLGIAGAGVGFILAFYLAGQVYDYQDSVDGVHLPDVDAIVCLAGGRGRITAAGDLWYRYWELSNPSKPTHLSPSHSLASRAANPSAKPTVSPSPSSLSSDLRPSTQPAPMLPALPRLYFSGMGPQTTWNVVARQFRRGVLEVIRPHHVLIEKESSNTDENARWLIRNAQKEGWKKILLLTSSYHMKRARFIFEAVMRSEKIDLKIETLSVYQEPFAPDEWRTGPNGIRVTLMEYLKGLYYSSFWYSAGTRR